jgi:hypothetical protein
MESGATAILIRVIGSSGLLQAVQRLFLTHQGLDCQQEISHEKTQKTQRRGIPFSAVFAFFVANLYEALWLC